ncbi:MAG TPA: FemAB family XrtA/PEP-CTERM system-associated protein [Vicinamibacterales bacterium]|jgi:FemAB-related protein (PEP-CTERM system-associated)|nr:FemAB family XrtA/PEP-CTERM system-associated protein [Vicinamibacterales bacterium]
MVIATGAARLIEPVVTVSTTTPASECAAYVALHRAATAYHDPAWLDVIRRSFGHDTRYLAALTDDGIAGVLPLVLFNSRLFGRFAVSLPFVNYGGVLCDTPAAGDALVNAAIEETQRAGGTHLELRHTCQFDPSRPSRRHKVAMRLRLAATAEAQWLAIDKKLRNQVRKGEKSQLQVEVGGGELVPEFYTVFARNMRDLGTPVYSRRFFDEVLSTFPSRSRVFVVRLGNVPVAASIVHSHRDTVEVPWASSLREYNPLCANVLLYWHMLKFACEQGFMVFDFGRSTPGGGTFKFKEQWGAVPTELVWEYWLANGRALPDLGPTNPKYAAVIDTWKRLPVWLTTAIGPRIVRNLP